MNHLFRTNKYRDNSRQHNNYKEVSKTQKDAEYNFISSEDKLSEKRNYMQFEYFYYEIPSDDMDDSIHNNLPENPPQNTYIPTSKKLKSSAGFNQQDSVTKQEEQNNHDLFRSDTNLLVKNPENFDNEVSRNSNDSFWSKLQPDIENHNTDTQINKTDESEIKNYCNQIFDNIYNLKKLSKLGIEDQDTFAQNDSDDKFTINFQFDKLLLIKDGDDAFKILVLEPLNWLENKKSEIIFNFHPGFAKLNSYGCIEVIIINTLSHLDYSTIKFAFEKVSLNDRATMSETQLLDVPSMMNENSQQNPGKKKNISECSHVLIKYKESDLQNDNENQTQPKQVKSIKKATTKTKLNKLERGLRGKYKKIKQIRKKGNSHGLENYLIKRLKENFLNNGSMIERYLIKMFVSKYVTLQQPNVDHMVSENQLDELMKKDTSVIHTMNNKLRKIIENFYKESKRISLQKLKKTSANKTLKIKRTKKHVENSLYIINEATDGSIERKIDKPSKKGLRKLSLNKSEIGIESLVPHNNTFATTENGSRECSDDDSEYDSMFSSNCQTDPTCFEDSA